jgi:hypothetical protein
MLSINLLAEPTETLSGRLPATFSPIPKQM